LLKEDQLFLAEGNMNLFKGLSFLILPLVAVLLFPSCIKYYELSETEFPQGKEKEINEKIIAENVKTQKILDQFLTIATFDVLYLSDDIRKLYTEIYCRKRGKDENFHVSMLRRQLEENRHWVSFYVLSYLPKLEDKAINDKDTDWTFFLEAKDGKKISPVSIKEVELSPEIKYFFGYRVSDFKTPFLVKFPAKDIISQKDEDGKLRFKMFVSSVNRESCFTWGYVDPMLHVRKWEGRHDDYYWV